MGQTQTVMVQILNRFDAVCFDSLCFPWGLKGVEGKYKCCWRGKIVSGDISVFLIETGEY